MLSDIALNIKSIFHQICPKDVPEDRACLIWALAAVIGLPNKRVIIQAGTCLWPCTAPAMDNGIGPTHFGFEWNPNDHISKAMRTIGCLPEMHIWAAIPEENTIIDFTTKYFIKNAQDFGINWTAPEPPKYLYKYANMLPTGVVYRPALGAYFLAQERMQSFIKSYKLPPELMEKI